MDTSSLIVGPGPGSQILQALVNHWGVGMHPEPRPTPPEFLLPPWWQVLLHGTGFPSNSSWMDRWATVEPAGPWAPNALTLMTHTNGGRVVVDLDINDDGTQATWWILGSQVRLLATNLKGLADLLSGGPESLRKLRLEDPDAIKTVAAYKGFLPIDPLTTQWKSHWTESMDVFFLGTPGQGVHVGPEWTRHPGQLIFARPEVCEKSGI